MAEETNGSQPSETLPNGPCPPEDKLKEVIHSVIEEVGAQNLTTKALRKRLEGEFRISFTPHKDVMTRIVMDKMKSPEMQRELAKAAKAQEEGLVKGGMKKKAKKEGGAKRAGAPRAAKEKAPARAKKEGKPEGYPKAALTAYFLFAADNREKLKETEPTLSVTEVGKRNGTAWAALPDDEKAVYQDKAKKDKERFEREMEEYTAQGGKAVGRQSKAKQSADAGAKGPKKPKTAFFAFMDEKRPILMAEGLKVTEVGKQGGVLWKALSDEEKKPYVALAEADKARYEKECANTGFTGAARKPARAKATGAKRTRKAKDDASSAGDTSSGSESDSSSGSSSSSASSSSSSTSMTSDSSSSAS